MRRRSCSWSLGLHNLRPLRFSALHPELECNHAAPKAEEGSRFGTRFSHVEEVDSGKGLST